ncbi:hypothetical protein M569_14157, partial [Genlisea aurea]
TARQPLVPTENKNGTSHHSRSRELSSRCRSPVPSGGTVPKRYPSPNARNVSLSSSLSTAKRSVSVEKKHHLRPSSSSSSSTPVQDVNGEELFVRKQSNSKLPESLWPSTMRSLTVSFQSDAYAVPVSKKEKPVSHTSSDRTPRLPSNVSHKQGEVHASRRPTPGRKRTPLKGSNASESENSKPVDSLHHRLVEQHQWPSRKSGKVSNDLNRSIVDLFDKTSKFSLLSSSRRTDTPSSRRLSLDGATKPALRSSSDLLMQISRDDCSIKRLGPSISSDRVQMVNAAARALFTPGMRPQSPSPYRGNSPSRTRATIPSSRGTSPSRPRQSSPTRQPQIPTSVLSFIVDIKKGKKAVNHIDDAHLLRILYNRQLQWRFVNAQMDAALQSQKVKAQKMLYCVNRQIADLWDWILEKRIALQQMNVKSKLNSFLNNQLTYLDVWASIEKDHIYNLSWTIQNLQDSTIRIPITAGARGDIKSLKAAVCSAVDVMQALVSSLYSILPRMEEISRLLFELADMAAHERAFLYECESVLGDIDALQVEEYSLRTHVLQVKQAILENGGRR